MCSFPESWGGLGGSIDEELVEIFTGEGERGREREREEMRRYGAR